MICKIMYMYLTHSAHKMSNIKVIDLHDLYLRLKTIGFSSLGLKLKLI